MQQRQNLLRLSSEDIYTFRMEDGDWYIDIQNYNELGWCKEDLQLKEGALKFLNKIARGEKEVRVQLATEPIENADVLELVRQCEAPQGGAIYQHKPFRDINHGGLFWICDLALLVFGHTPEHIYLKRVHRRSKDKK